MPALLLVATYYLSIYSEPGAVVPKVSLMVRKFCLACTLKINHGGYCIANNLRYHLRQFEGLET